MLKRIGTRWLLTLGLVSIVVSALLMAQFIGLIPDRAAQTLQARAALAELMAASVSGHLGDDSPETVRGLMDFAVERQAALQSMGLRLADGGLLLEAGDHPAQWSEAASSDRITVPLQFAGEPWGRLEMQFEPLQAPGWRGWVADEHLRLIALVALMCTVGFAFYLRRMLRQLDPSRAVPERVRAAFDTLTESVVLTDANQFIVLANSAFARLVGDEPGALVGRPLARFDWLDREGSTVPDADRPWHNVLDSGEPVRHQHLSMVDSAGRRRSFQVNCSPIMAEGSKVGGVLVSLEDVTGLEEIQAELRESKLRADEANRAKTEFLANMSHEIRTPMNAILGFTDVLRRGAGRAEAVTRRHLDTIHRNGRNLLELINDILDLSKVESGRLEIETVDSAPHRLIQDVIEVMSVRAQDRQIGLRFIVDGEVPALLPIDATRLRQIVTNLVGNAIKFTEHGEVRVVERWTPGPQPLLAIDVVDSGIGVPADKLDAIFEPFVQAEGSTTRRYGGTGLGLAISRKFARAMGGDIRITSVPGEGSTFTIGLAFAPGIAPTLISAAAAEADVHEADHVDQRDWEFAPAQVLVVDDSPENRELVRLMLEEVGLEVVEAANGREAIERVEQQDFPIVLMDVHMPVMDGNAAVAEMRQRGWRLPVMAFTADAIQGFEHRIAAAGFDGHLTKPIDLDAMLSLLRQYLPVQARRPAEVVDLTDVTGVGDAAPIHAGPGQTDSGHPPSHPSLPSSPTPAPALRAAASGGPLVSRFAGHPKLAAVVQMFVDRLPERIARMDQAGREGDWDTVAELAHWLKGSGGSVGFDAFTDPAKKLELCAREGATDAALGHLALIVDLAARVVGPTPIAQTGSAMPSTPPASAIPAPPRPVRVATTIDED